MRREQRYVQRRTTERTIELITDEAHCCPAFAANLINIDISEFFSHAPGSLFGACLLLITMMGMRGHQGRKDYLAFGQFSGHYDYFPLINRIRTYTESDALHDAAILQRLVSDASMFLFLGFGFHRQNLELLRTRETLGFRSARILATVFKVHPANVPELSDALSALLKVNRSTELLSMTAAQILQELRMKIMMAVG